MMPLTASAIRQSAVLAYREGQVCMVHSSSGKKWVLPKGHIEPWQTPGEAALQEAWEEAGLVGHLDPQVLGTYRYQKGGRLRHVTLYLMHVTDIAATWPEDHRRQRCWVGLEEAISRLDHFGLRKLLSNIELPVLA